MLLFVTKNKLKLFNFYLVVYRKTRRQRRTPSSHLPVGKSSQWNGRTMLLGVYLYDNDNVNNIDFNVNSNKKKNFFYTICTSSNHVVYLDWKGSSCFYVSYSVYVFKFHNNNNNNNKKAVVIIFVVYPAHDHCHHISYVFHNPKNNHIINNSKPAWRNTSSAISNIITGLKKKKQFLDQLKQEVEKFDESFDEFREKIEDYNESFFKEEQDYSVAGNPINTTPSKYRTTTSSATTTITTATYSHELWVFCTCIFFLKIRKHNHIICNFNYMNHVYFLETKKPILNVRFVNVFCVNFKWMAVSISKMTSRINGKNRLIWRNCQTWEQKWREMKNLSSFLLRHKHLCWITFK